MYYRLENQTTWQSTILAPGSRKPVFVEVKDNTNEEPTLLIRFEGRQTIGKVQMQIWKGKGQPPFDENEAVVIDRR